MPGLEKQVHLSDCKNGVVHVHAGHKIRSVSLSGESRSTARVATGTDNPDTHISAIGRLPCMPTGDAKAFDGFIPGYIPLHICMIRFIQTVSACTPRFDTQTSKEVICEQAPHQRIAHLQSTLWVFPYPS